MENFLRSLCEAIFESQNYAAMKAKSTFHLDQLNRWKFVEVFEIRASSTFFSINDVYINFLR